MVRAYVNRVVQVGVETVKGTAVPCNKSLPSTSIDLTRELETKEYRALGYKPQTVTKIVKDYAVGKMTAPFNFTEIVYPLSTLVEPVITTPGGGTTSRQWKFTSAAQGADAFKTLTIQEGDGDAAVQAAYCVFTEFGINLKNDDATIDGSLIAQILTGASLTGSPSSLTLLPIGPREIDIYMDAIGGTIGTTKIVSAMDSSFKITNKQVPKWVLNTTFPAFSETVEVAPSLSAEIVTEHDSASRTLFSAVSVGANPVKLIRFKATGPIIEAAIAYSFTLDFAAQVVAMAQEDANGIWGYKYSLRPIYHATFGNKAWEATVVNTLTAL